MTPEAQRQPELELVQEELQQLNRLFAKMLLLAEVESGLGAATLCAAQPALRAAGGAGVL